jgi:hypothetical protein
MFCCRVLPEPNDDLSLQAQMNTLNEKVNQMHLAIDSSIKEQTKQVPFDKTFFLFLSSALLNRLCLV